MKRNLILLVIGILIGYLASPYSVQALENIKLIINNQEIQCDTPPQIINGRVMVPARFVAEPLGATVEWDGENRVVRITGKNETTSTQQQSSVKEDIIEETTFEGMKAIKVNGIVYFMHRDYYEKLSKSPNHHYFYDSSNLTITVKTEKKTKIIKLSNKNTHVYDSLMYINSSCYFF